MQLKDDLQRCALTLKESAESFNSVIAGIEQVLSILVKACDFPALNYPQTEAETICDSQRLLTVKEIAAYLAVSERAVYQWIKTRNFPCRYVGSDFRFDLVEVEAWTKTPESKSLEKDRLRVVR